ncbi:MAG: hypothetical protein IJO99_05860 [Ruminococcus sp.]|nr:hypothetical protein [Ruminococcus sp.]
MLHFLSHKVNLKNEARLYYARFIRSSLFSFLFFVAGVALMIFLCSALNPQPNSKEGWIIFALLAVVSVAFVAVTTFNARILSSSYCVFAVYRNDTITITPLSEVALKNAGRIKISVKDILKSAKQASVVMHNFVERYDFEDFFLDSSFLSAYSHNLVKILGIRRMGKFTVIRCVTEKYNPATNKQETKKRFFYIDRAVFENSHELISVLESRLRNGL